MKKKTVVISCAPILNDAQSDGLEQLIKDFEKAGCSVYYYGNAANLRFQRYHGDRLSYNRALYKIPFYWVLKHIDHNKWMTRLTHHIPPGDTRLADNKLLRNLVRTYVQYFCAIKPDLFICWNPHSPSFGPMADTARLMGIVIGAIEWGLLPGTFILDKSGTLATSQVFNRAITYSEPEKFEITGERIFSELSRKSISLYQQTTEQLPMELLNTDDGSIKILVIGIDMVDSGSYPETHQDSFGLLPFHTSCREQALAIAASDTNFRVVLKPHPSHNYQPESGEIAANCWIINSNPDHLINWADVIICSGSKMEFSALLAGKPLVNVGAGILYKKGCSYEANTASQLREKILQAAQHGITPQQLQAFKLFLGFLKEDYLYAYDRPHNNKVVIDRMLQQPSILQKFRKTLLM